MENLAVKQYIDSASSCVTYACVVCAICVLLTTDVLCWMFRPTAAFPALLLHKFVRQLKST